ncbi:ArsR/SmtB family transcription factor [Sediminibacillus halophilus]|uniref:Predicted transcriptional regulator n=1 Tax=Sediminibacillus halophilus TaxID=482461 RepID=A0A1G9RT91_9BACI|nr:helix-turn-helix domain-containing protein [Sediminibacillus halophilus]SDM26446.1 Predicted transcriptional regulator [Sediminibacillus halophilus]
MRTLHLNFEEAIEICKAISNKHRMAILRLLSERPHNVNELAERLDLPFSTTAVNVKKLEDVNLIITELLPGRGTQKINTKNYDQIVIDIGPQETKKPEHAVVYDMPIGEYSDCEVEPSCGLVGETDYIGIQDDPRSFYETGRSEAQLLFFKAGHVEYRFPNRLPYGDKATQIEFSAELCSEAPLYKLDWPSDITVWVNGHEIATWTSPGDFGGERGFLTPDWWMTNHTQYGLLKNWRITKEGCFLDGMKVNSDCTIDTLKIAEKPFISFKIGIKSDAVNMGGLNLFGNKFGNYEQGIVMKLKVEEKN